ncbi:MAG TPA: FtsK/SpoIIIE domain-containing protein [Polyangiaceae bacterium]|jgi:S-DNA-T family DNA segregation ATPase FtsK/SpoIIIE|nr:FtsK/SpoIIIE domain-containing protein [Polyangiaceae bacterium]
MTERISVTEVRNALRCPRIFALGRLRKQAVAFPVGSSCLGATFHRVLERFSGEVGQPPRRFAALLKQSPLDDVQAALSEWLLDLLIGELEADPTYSTIPGEVDDLAEALRELARHFAGRLREFGEDSPASALPKLVKSAELAIEATIGPDGPLVSGRIDALYGDARGGHEVVEYKLTDEANDELDRAQVALYRDLLRTTERLEARATVLRFTPTLRETAMSAQAAEALLTQTVRPLLRRMVVWAGEPLAAPATRRTDLCPACPVSRDCIETYPERVPVRDDPPMAATRPHSGLEQGMVAAAQPPTTRPVDADEEGRAEAQGVADRILAELKKQGVAAICPRAPVVGPTLYLIEVVRSRGAVSHLDRAAEDVRHRLAAEIGIHVDYTRDGGRRLFVVKRPAPRAVLLGPLLEKKRDYLAARPGRFVVGEKPDGDILCADLSDSSTPHLLIAGQTGSGKSVLMQSIIASLLQFHDPGAIRFTLIDPKRVTFIGSGFRTAVASHLDGPVRFDVEEALPVIERLVDLMEERYRIFQTAQVQDIAEYNEQASAPERLERRVLVIDEFQDLIADKDSAATFFGGIRRLGAKARAAGIHMILATQRPDRDTVPPIIKANLGGRIALQVGSQTNSRIILDQGGAETLLGKGDLLASLGRGVVRAQAPLLARG